MVTYSLPLFVKNRVKDIISKLNFKCKKDFSISRFSLNSVLLNIKIQDAKNYNDFKEIWDEIFVSNCNLDLRSKLDILKKFKNEIELEIEELENYFSFKELNKIDENEVKKFEEMGQIPFFVREKMKKGNKNEKSN